MDHVEGAKLKEGFTYFIGLKVAKNIIQNLKEYDYSKLSDSEISETLYLLQDSIEGDDAPQYYKCFTNIFSVSENNEVYSYDEPNTQLPIERGFYIAINFIYFKIIKSRFSSAIIESKSDIDRKLFYTTFDNIFNFLSGTKNDI